MASSTLGEPLAHFYGSTRSVFAYVRELSKFRYPWPHRYELHSIDLERVATEFLIEDFHGPCH